MWRFQSGPGRNIQIEMFRNWHVLVTDIERMCLALKCHRRLSEVQNWAPELQLSFLQLCATVATRRMIRNEQPAKQSQGPMKVAVYSYSHICG